MSVMLTCCMRSEFPTQLTFQATEEGIVDYVNVQQRQTCTDRYTQYQRVQIELDHVCGKTVGHTLATVKGPPDFRTKTRRTTGAHPAEAEVRCSRERLV